MINMDFIPLFMGYAYKVDVLNIFFLEVSTKISITVQNALSQRTEKAHVISSLTYSLDSLGERTEFPKPLISI